MTREEQEEHFNVFTHLMYKTMISKSDDYADVENCVLSNFKLAGNISGGSAKINCLNLIATKVARLGVLLKGKTPKNESVSDSLLDLANYAVLLDMIIADES